jgi:glycosidase
MTIPGIPVIYYGDEFGMPGGGDPDNRRMMKFDSLNNHEKALKVTISKLAKLRGSSLALIFGDFRTLKVTDKVYVYMRSYFNQAVIVVFNKDRSARKVDFDIPARYGQDNFQPQFSSSAASAGGKISLELPGTSFEIFVNQPENQ